MKAICLLMMLLLLTGCAAPAWETVDDVQPLVPATAQQTSSYTIQIGLPEDVTLLEETEGWKLYGNTQEDLEVETRSFLASDLSQAVKTLSGYDSSQLTILQTSRFDLPQYQFVWLSQTAEGSRVYRANLVMNGMDCYAVVCSRPETAGSSHDDAIRSVISSFGLYIDEGV